MAFKEYCPEELFGPLNDVERKHAPKRLYLAGDKSILDEGGRVSIVGSRKASKEGLRQTSDLSHMLVEGGIVIVSGLAEGIDTAAHKATIKAGGRTIAVLGTPLDMCFPAVNRSLQEKIMKHHLAISQFPSGSPSNPGNFPMRNRTMALISDATVIVEASEKSGTQHQGWEALRLGRTLFVMKFLVEQGGPSWVERMMEYGAQILTRDNVELLLEFLPKRKRENIAGIAF